MLAAELSHQLKSEGSASGKHRNGSSPKIMRTPTEELPLDIPRDRLINIMPSRLLA
jgi:hypothetical protein